MEVLSPAFAVVEQNPAALKIAKPARPTSALHPAGIQATPVRLPLGFVLAGLASLLASVGFFLAQPDLLATYHYTPHLIAITHLFVLGFIGSIVMGAMYQLVPVTLETRLFSEKLARWQFVAHAGGVTGMVWSFWNYNMAMVGAFSTLLTLGVAMFVFNLAVTLGRVKGWGVVKFGIASALFWLLATVVAGLLLAASKCWSFISFSPLAAMHAHAHLGVVGLFVMMIVTVSYKLVPMFTLSELQNARRAWYSVALINLGLAGVFLTILWQSSLKPLAALVVIAGFVLYGWEITVILRARNRRTLDRGIRYFLTALALLVPLSILALVLCWSGLSITAFTMQLESVYGLLALAGFVGLAILGMLYKIVPFLVWFHSYSRHIGLARVPALADMYSVVLQVAGYWSFLAGLGALCVATALGNAPGVRWSGGLLACSLVIFAVNMGKILSHYVRPEIQAFTPKLTLSIKDP